MSRGTALNLYYSTLALDFYQGDLSRPLTQFRKEGGEDIKVGHIFWIRVKARTSSLAQGVEKDQAVNKY